MSDLPGIFVNFCLEAADNLAANSVCDPALEANLKAEGP